MQIEFAEEGHNRVSWRARSSIVQVEVGLLLFAVAFTVLAIPVHSPARWPVAAAVIALCVLIGVALALTMPLIDQGALERLPEGGQVERARVWLLRGTRPVLSAELESLQGFEVETTDFEDAPPDTYQRARLWAVAQDGQRYVLTGWAVPASVVALGEALGKTARRTFEVKPAGVV